MRLWKALRGSKSSEGNAAKQLVAAIRPDGDGLTDSLWQKCMKAENFEDALDKSLPMVKIQELEKENPIQVRALTVKCVSVVQDAADTKEVDKDDLDEAVERSLENSLLILSRLLTFCDSKLFWPPAAEGEQTSGASPGEQALNALMAVLFMKGYAVDPVDEKKGDDEESSDDDDDDDDDEEDEEEEDEEDDEDEEDEEKEKKKSPKKEKEKSAKEKKAEEKKKKEEEKAAKAAAAKEAEEAGGPKPVDATRLWEAGVGPDTAEEPGKPDKEMVQTRHLLLQCLVGALRQGRETGITEGLQHLSDPEKSVPRRPELMYSLLSVGLGYDPHGSGIPYAAYFSSSQDEENAAAMIQVLGLLLQRHADVTAPDSASLFLWCPQEQIGKPPAFEHSKDQAFRNLLDTMCSEREVQFIYEGVTTIFNSAYEAKNTYLPGAMKAPRLCRELLVVLFHFSGSTAFLTALTQFCKCQSIAECVASMSFEDPLEEEEEEDKKKKDKNKKKKAKGHDDLDEGDLNLQMVVAATLVRLTSSNEFSASLNEEGEMGLDDFIKVPDEGTVGDIVVLTACKHIGDKLSTAHTNVDHYIIVEYFLVTVCNVSIFLEGFSKESVLAYLALFDRCCKPQQLRKGIGAGIMWMPYFLEVFENALHYQYPGNRDLIYGLLTRQKLLKELFEVATGRSDPPPPPPGGPGASGEPAEPGTPGDSGSPETPKANGKSPAEAEAQEKSGGSSKPLTPMMPPEWWKERCRQLEPIINMIENVAPRLEEQVAKKEITSPDQAKALLPRTLLGLLPPPHHFVMRAFGTSKHVHKACETILWQRVSAGGVLNEIWDSKDDEKEEDEEEDEEEEEEEEEESEEEEKPPPPPPKKGKDKAPKSKGKAKAAPAAPAPQTPEDAAAALKAQLEAAAAAGIDISALLAGAGVAKAAGAPPAEGGAAPNQV